MQKPTLKLGVEMFVKSQKLKSPILHEAFRSHSS